MESLSSGSYTLVPKFEQDLLERPAVSQQAKNRGTRRKIEIASLVLNLLLLAALIPLCAKEVRRNFGYETFPATSHHGTRATIGTLVNEYQSLRFQFLSSNPVFNGPPSPAVDDAWAAITENKLMIVPESDISQNTSSRHALRGANAHGQGVLAKFEGFHALHCVNLLWRYTWPSYYTAEQAELERSPVASHVHLDHCADLLRQTLQCNMDFSIHTYYRSNNAVYGDFKTLHQCQNYHAVLEYVEAHQWSEEYVDKLEGYEKLPAEDS